MPAAENPFLISIHPQYVRAILAGTKTVECRKSRIGLRPGAHLFLYATAPEMAILGQADVVAIHEGSPAEMWEQHADKTCVREADFFRYYSESKRATLLALDNVEVFRHPVALAQLRVLEPRFSPPQTARRLSDAFNCIPQLGNAVAE